MSGTGWKEEIMTQLKEEADKKPMSKYGVICFDEVKIKEGVVYNPHTAELIGEKHYNF